MENSELRRKDYIPIVGLVNYGWRNWRLIKKGISELYKERTLEFIWDKVQVKHTLERTALLTFFNGAVVDVVKRIGEGIVQLYK